MTHWALSQRRKQSEAKTLPVCTNRLLQSIPQFRLFDSSLAVTPKLSTTHRIYVQTPPGDSASKANSYAEIF